jgi:pimeloyl-ACP methyl ester carboxylesterase
MRVCKGRFTRRLFQKGWRKTVFVDPGRGRFFAPPDKAGRVLKAELPVQVTYVEIPNAAHALSSERPDEITAHIVKYFKKSKKVAEKDRT